MKENPSSCCSRTGIGRGQHRDVHGAGVDRFTLGCHLPLTSWLLTINLASPTNTSPSTSRPRLEEDSSSHPWTAWPTSSSRWPSGGTIPESRVMTPPSVRWPTTTLPWPRSLSLRRAELTMTVFPPSSDGPRKSRPESTPRPARSKKRTAPPLLALRSFSLGLRRLRLLSCFFGANYLFLGDQVLHFQVIPIFN